MTDLFTPAMPLALRDKLILARVDLEKIAAETDTFLAGFFDETWAECHRTHTVEHDGKTIEVPGTPDFNEFDRKANRYEKAVRKLRSMLWEIHGAATVTTGIESGENDA